MLKSQNKKAFTSHFVFETEMMQYRTKMVQFKTEMMWFRTWMTWFGTDVIYSKKWCDLGINHTAEGQSDCTDSQWFQSGCNKSPYFIISATSSVYVAADKNKIYNPVML